MTAAAKTPVLFLSHGAPTFAIEPSLLGPLLRTLGTQLPEFKAVLVVSPHWQTQGVKVMRTARPETVHDFGGFPSSLYALQYPVDGAPALANEAVRMLNAAGFSATGDERREIGPGAGTAARAEGAHIGLRQHDAQPARLPAIRRPTRGLCPGIHHLGTDRRARQRSPAID